MFEKELTIGPIKETYVLVQITLSNKVAIYIYIVMNMAIHIQYTLTLFAPINLN